VALFQRRLPHALQAWVVVGASCLVMGMAFGMLISVSVFLKPLETEFGWGRGVTSFAYSSASFMTGVVGIAMGRLVDRISPRPIVLTGAVMLGAGHLLLSRIDAVWQLYLIYGLLVGGLGAGCFVIPLLANVGFWFERHRGLAIGAVMAGQSLGGAVMPGISRYLLTELAWRDAYAVLGLAAWAVLIPLALLVRAPPGLAALKASAHAQGAPLAAIAPNRLIATLCVAIVCCCVCMAIPVMHVYPLAVEAGFAPSQAAAVLGTMMSVSIVGRIGIGKVADHVGGIRSLLLASGIQTALIFWFSQMHTLAGLLLIAVLFGVGYGGVVPSYAIIIRELMPVRRVGFAMGLVFFFGNMGMSLGGYLGGLLYDLSGAYPVAYATGALAGLVNLAIVGALLVTTRARQTAAPVPA
jgi:MFS family permease